MSDAYLLIGEAPAPEMAERIAAQYRNCPYVHFIAAFGAVLVGIWYLTEAQRWWLEAVAQRPQWTLGLERAAVYRTATPAYPDVFAPRDVGACRDTAPCGSDCEACDRQAAGCRCPGLA